MSILNGAFAPEYLNPEKDPFGTPFEAVGSIQLPGAMDAAVYENYLVAAGRGKLELYDLSDGEPRRVGELDGLGDSRQLVISDGFAYLTARADALYIIDLRGEHPVLASHPETQELATGVSCANGLLAVTNRHMGCELFDVRDPYHPERLCDFLCGEAQSVWLEDNLAVVSDWMNKRVRVFDLTNPRAPQVLSCFSVDGFADGVCVFPVGPDPLHLTGRKICAVATGHHAASLKNRRKYNKYSFVTAEMLAEGYGGGHGVEFFDITDPENPEYLSTLKAPPHFGGIDTWRVFFSKNRCYFTDSMGGLFEIDCTDPGHPFFTRRFRLPPLERQGQIPPSIQPVCGSITGTAVLGDFLCVAGGDEIRILKRSDGTDPSGARLRAASARVDFDAPAPVSQTLGGNLTATCGQMHAFLKIDGMLLCAAGNEGIFDASHGRRLTETVCCDLTSLGTVILSSEFDRGIAAYRLENGVLTELDRMTFGPTNPVRQAVVFNDKILLELGKNKVQTLRFDEKFELCGGLVHMPLLYHRQISHTPAGKNPLVYSLMAGPELMTLTENGYVRSDCRFGAECCPFEEGACGYRDGMIIIFHRQYFYLAKPGKELVLPSAVHCEGAKLNGSPFVCGDRLVLLNRITGRVEILDVSDPAHPRFEKRVETHSHPEYASLIDGHILVACGYGGILEID